MKRMTKIQYLPAKRSLRRELHKLDKQKGNWVNDLFRYMMREVARPKVVEIGGKKVEYTGP